MATRKSQKQEKICNICGEFVLKFSVDRNAIICEKCLPTKPKKIPSESTMVMGLLNKHGVQTRLK